MAPMASPSASARPMPIPSVQDERDHKALIETLTNAGRPAVLQAGPLGLAPRVDRPAEERLPDPGLAVQRGPHGDGLRPARLSAGRRRRLVLDASYLIREVSSLRRSVPAIGSGSSRT